MKFRVWALLPDRTPRGSGWSLVARGLSEEEAEVFRRSLLFPVHVEPEPN